MHNQFFGLNLISMCDYKQMFSVIQCRQWVNALVFITLIFNLERVASLHFVVEWEDMANHISVF